MICILIKSLKKVVPVKFKNPLTNPLKKFFKGSLNGSVRKIFLNPYK